MDGIRCSYLLQSLDPFDSALSAGDPVWSKISQWACPGAGDRCLAPALGASKQTQIATSPFNDLQFL